MKKPRRSRKREEKRKTRKERIVGEYVKVIDRGSNRCGLCGRRFKSSGVKVMIGGHFRYAHMECVTSCSFSMMD